jgi:hypothetical protein
MVHPVTMAHYFFDTRDDGCVTMDDIGLDLPDLVAVKALAAKSLGELAVDVLPGSDERCLGVDVRDFESEPVLTTELVFKARILKAA